MKAGQLLHVSEVGDFKSSDVFVERDPEGSSVLPDPASLKTPLYTGVTAFPALLPAPSQLADEDVLDGEQTWPTKAELAGEYNAAKAGGDEDEDDCDEDDEDDDEDDNEDEDAGDDDDDDDDMVDDGMSGGVEEGKGGDDDAAGALCDRLLSL